MVTIQKATEQISKAEEQIEQQEKKLETAREEFIRVTKPQAATIQRQLQLEKTFGRGAVGLFLEEERKIQKRGLPQLGKAEQELVRFREEVGLAKTEIAEIERKNLAIRKQNEAIAKRNQDRATALKLFRKGRSVAGESAFVRKLVQRLQTGQELQREQLIREQFAGQVSFFQPGQAGEVSFIGTAGQPVSFISREDIKVEQLQQIPVVEKSLISDVKEFVFGETGKKFVGIGIPTTPLFISFEEIAKAGREFRIPEKEKVSQFLTTITQPTTPGLFDVSREIRKESISAGLLGTEFGVQTLAEFIPTTPGEVAITGAFVGALFVAPPIVKLPLLGFAGVSGFKTALDPELIPQERVAGGLVAVGAGIGIAGIGLPFLRGIGAKPVKIAPEGFQAIKGVKGVGDIGLIQPGKGVRVGVDLPSRSPLVRGGFGRRPGGEEIFIGEQQFLTTSQRGLFKTGKDIPLETEFFVTPQEPFIGIAETRVSRLGLVEPFKFPKDVEIGFGLPKKPQIGIAVGDVARAETARAFKLGTGTELEAIKTTGIITDVTKIGRTRIKAQAVEIFEFKVGKVDTKFDIGKIDKGAFRTTEPTTRVSGEGLISSIFRTTRRVSVKTTPLVSLATIPSVSLAPTKIISPEITPPVSPPITPTAPTISPPIISPPTITTIPPTSPRLPTRPPPRRGRIKESEKKGKKGKRRKTPIRPSFTGIILGIESPAFETTFAGRDIGILPSKIRGLRTGRRRTRRKLTDL